MQIDRATILDAMQQGEQLFLPHLSVDTVVLGYEDQRLKLLLLQVAPDIWMLPGGYVLRQESLDEAASRLLHERTGLEGGYLRQFHTFGAAERSFGDEITTLFKQFGLSLPSDHWMLQRFVSVGYYALVHLPETRPHAGLFAQSVQWFDVTQLPSLLLDHKAIIDCALSALQVKLSEDPVAFHLLPTKFTMPDLHRLFETIYQKKMDRSRFQKKMLGYGIFERLEKKSGLPHRSPYLYCHRAVLQEP